MKQEIKALLDLYKITIDSEFIPWSKSRNKNEKTPSLNWKVTLKQDGRVILTTDYMAGCAHTPSYQQRETVDSGHNVRIECENGFPVFGTMGMVNKYKPILPDIQDVIYSLMLDSEVSDYGEFEEWAASFGYDPDSRQAEQTYNACLKIALRFNSGLSSVIREALKEAYQDY